MNYTGGPSISGCRPVLSLYPTHRFCQYLLLIFITFTNSFLFNRAFSTNSRSLLRHAAGGTGPGCALSGASRQLPQRGRSSTSPSLLRNATARVAAPSVCFAAARILLAAAPTAPPCFRHWRRSSPLLLPRGGFGIAENFSSSPEAPLLGELSSEARLRGCTKESLTDMPMAPPLGELAGASPTERARPLTANPRHSDSIALTKSLPIAAPAALSCRACPLRHLR